MGHHPFRSFRTILWANLKLSLQAGTQALAHHFLTQCTTQITLFLSSVASSTLYTTMRTTSQTPLVQWLTKHFKLEFSFMTQKQRNTIYFSTPNRPSAVSHDHPYVRIQRESCQCFYSSFSDFSPSGFLKFHFNHLRQTLIMFNILPFANNQTLRNQRENSRLKCDNCKSLTLEIILEQQFSTCESWFL